MYNVHPSIAYTQTILNNLSKTTGKNLQEWLDILSRSGLKTEKELRLWLKKNFSLGETSAVLLARYALGKSPDDEAEEYLTTAPIYIDQMYAGHKEHLRPLHDALINQALSLYPDIRVSPCKTIVPLYRNHVIAQIRPSTRSRIDFGLSLKNMKQMNRARLIETGGLAKGDRITHRIEIYSLNDINDELIQWLKYAYELDKKS